MSTSLHGGQIAFHSNATAAVVTMRLKFFHVENVTIK